MQISVKTNADQFAKQLNDFARRQLPFAIVRALNDTADRAKWELTTALPAIFNAHGHQPTRFTMQSIGTRRATKETLTAVVAVKGIQAKYLALEETGGTRVPSMNTRKPSAKALVLPGKAIPLDSFGNIPSGLVGRLMQRAKAQQAAAHAGKRRRNGQQDTGLVYMSGSNPNNQRGLGGLFKRMAGHHLMRLIAFEPSESYRPRFGFHDRIAKIVLATFVERLKARFQEALATARR